MKTLEAPVRIQRQRTKGWKMPPNTVYVGRPTKWGNPASVSDSEFDAIDAVGWYQNWLEGIIVDVDWPYQTPILSIRELRGKNLACWCSLDAPCHADVLLRLANA